MEYRLILFLFPIINAFYFPYKKFDFGKRYERGIYEISEALITTTKNKISDAFLFSGTYVHLLIDEGKIYSIDSTNQIEVKGNIKSKGHFLSINLIQVSYNKMIIACGEHFLYFADRNYNVLGTPIDYEPKIQNNIFGSTVLNMYNDQLLFVYSTFTQGKPIIWLDVYSIGQKTNTFTKKGGLSMVGVKKKFLLNVLDCKFFHFGNSIICALATENHKAKIGKVDEKNFTFIANETAFSVSELKLIKMTESIACVAYYLRMFAVEFYFISGIDSKINPIDHITLNTAYQTDVYAVVKKNKNTIILAEIAEHYKLLVHMITLFNKKEIFRVTFTIRNLYVNEMKMVYMLSGALDIIVKEQNNMIKSFLINIPKCKTFTIHLYSKEVRFISIPQVVFTEDDIKYLKFSKVFSKEGQATIKQNKIQYIASESGDVVIYYTVMEKEHQLVSSEPCRIFAKICNPACSSCTKYSMSPTNTYCKACKKDYYPLEDDRSKCILKNETIEGYYFNPRNRLFQKCYHRCQTCDEEKNNTSQNCLSCAKDFVFNNETKNCNCNPSKYKWYVKDGEDVCVEDCPSNFPYLVPKTQECVKKCPVQYNKLYFMDCLEFCPEGTEVAGEECRFTSMKTITKDLETHISNLLKYKPIDSFGDSNYNSTYHTYEVKDNGSEISNFSNVSHIDFGKCKEKLKKANNIESLLVFKIDISRKNHPGHQVEYSTFNLNGTKLNMSICEKEKIKVASPLNLEESESINLPTAKYLGALGYDMYNLDDKFYTDICTPYTTVSNTDIPLEDRKKDLYRNVSFCEVGCVYKKINFTTNKIYCLCQTKSKMSEIEEESPFVPVNEKGTRTIGYSNVRVIKCFKNIFRRGIVKNLGFWGIILVIVLEIAIIQNYFFSKVNLKNELKEILNSKLTFSEIESINGQEPKEDNFPLNIEMSNIYLKDPKKEGKENLEGMLNENVRNTNYILDTMDYQNSLLYDKRKFFNRFCSSLRFDHFILYIFVFREDYNAKEIKVLLLLLSIILHLSINILFSSDSELSYIYKHKGKVNVFCYTPKIILVVLFSSFLINSLKNHATPQKIIKKIDYEMLFSEDIRKQEELIKQLKRKLLNVFLFISVALILLNYYILAFVSVFINTQMFIVQEAAVSFIFGLVYPIIICFFGTIFRSFALKREKKAFFIISKILKWL